jgi:hypothetical protein
MICELERVVEKTVLVYFKVLSWHYAGETKEKEKVNLSL